MFAAFPIALFLMGAIMLVGFPLAFSLQSYFNEPRAALRDLS